MAPKSSIKGRRKQLQWNDPMDEILLDAFLHQAAKGNRVNGQFTTLGIEEVVQEVRTKTNMEIIEKEKVMNRMKTLKRNFAEAYDTFKGRPEFVWNPITKVIQAHEEAWNDLIKSNSNAIQWRAKPISQYDKLEELWGNDRAATTSMNGMQHRSNAAMKQGESSAGRQKKDLTAEIIGMKTAVERAIDVLSNGNSIIEKTKPRVYSGEEVYAELSRLGIDDDVKIDAYELLMDNQGEARKLFGLPVELRKGWLLKKFFARV